jgi:hypothetical protein
MRLTLVDGFRGFFLVFMMVIHANQVLDTNIGKFNHHYFGWVEDAQGFVFLSGLVVGLVYGGRYLRHGFAAMRAGIWRRIGTIYSHQVGLILLFLGSALLARHLALAPGVLGPYADEPVLFTALSALLLTGSMHMGILPMYIFFMLATPAALWLLRAGRLQTYVAISAALWGIAQLDLTDHLLEVLEARLAATGHPIHLGIFFNVLGWQALFFGGLFIGFQMAGRKLALPFLATPDGHAAFLCCVALFAVLGLYDRIVFDAWFGEAFSAAILAKTDRGNFSLIYLLAFVTDLYIVAWLLGPGRTAPQRLWRKASAVLVAVVSFRPLVFLGQHSLHVFSAHIVLVYILALAFRSGPPPEAVGSVLILLCPLPLFAVAWLHAQAAARAGRAAVGPAAGHAAPAVPNPKPQ